MEASTAAFVVIGLALPLVGGAAKYHRIHKFARTLRPGKVRRETDAESTPFMSTAASVPISPARPETGRD